MLVKNIKIILIALFISMSIPVQSAKPIEILKESIERIVAILQDPQYKNPDQKPVQREKIWSEVQKHFDFIEIAKRALARNWLIFTPQEREEFTHVFSELLKNTYLEKIQGEYKDEKVVYVGEEQVSDTKAVVYTKINREKIETPVDYSLLKMDDNTWKVYDVSVEGVSMVKNYRIQFKDILIKETPAQLIKRLKEKNAEQQKQKTTAN